MSVTHLTNTYIMDAHLTVVTLSTRIHTYCMSLNVCNRCNYSVALNLVFYSNYKHLHTRF